MARRSVLFSPGDRPELLAKAPGTGADVVVFDLEDAVAPGRKNEARAAVADVLDGLDPACEVCVRVTTDEQGADLDAILAADQRLDAVMVPKVETAAVIENLAARLDARGRSLPVFALIETAAGVLHAESIAAADATGAVCFGAEDLAADIGATRSREGTEVLFAREQVVLAAAAAGIDAIDTLVTDIEAPDHLREDAPRGADMGFDGKLAIHPDQVPVIHDAFAPAPERVAWAERVLDAAATADGEDRGVTRVDGEMIDAPLVARAERVLALAGETGRDASEKAE